MQNNRSMSEPAPVVLKLPSSVTLKSVEQWLAKEKVMSRLVDCIDFSDVKHCDSTVLGLMLHLQNQLPDNQPIRVVDFPQTLKPLLALYNLESLVTLQ